MVKCTETELGSMSILHMYRYFNLINLSQVHQVELSASNGNLWPNLMKTITMHLIYSAKCSPFGTIKKKDPLSTLSYSLVALSLMKILRSSWRSRHDTSFNFFPCERHIRVTDNPYYGCSVLKFGNGFVPDSNRNVGL